MIRNLLFLLRHRDPDSPDRFAQALAEARNPQTDMRQFSGLDHGAWAVSGYAVDSATITRRGTAVFEAIADWIASAAMQPLGS